VTDRMRILLAEFEPGIPANRTFATWNPADKHADIALSGGNLVASKSTVHASNWACVRGTTETPVGRWYAEFAISYTGAPSIMVGTIHGGFDLDQNPVNTHAGETVDRAGNVRKGPDVVGSIGAITSGSIVRMMVDADARVVWFARDNGAWVSAGFIAGLFDINPFPTAGILRPSGSTASITANFGATPFTYPVPEVANPGVYTQAPPTRTTLYLSSNGFRTGAGETPASTIYDGRIAGDSDVEFTREAGLSPWNNSGAARGGSITLINRDGGIDEWLAWEWRDAPFRLYSGYEGDDRAAFVPWSSGVVDRIEAIDGRRMRLVLADPLARLDVPVQSQLYADDAPNASLRGKPLPLVLGRPRWCEPQRDDTTPANRQYLVHDGAQVPLFGSAIDSVSDAYDRGDRFAGPDDPYTAHNPITLFNGGGFGGWANDSAGIPMPLNWARVTGFGATNDRFIDNSSALRCQSSGQLATAIYHSASTLQAGRRYTIQFTVTAVPTPGQITFRCDGPTPGLPFDDVVVPITSTGVKTVTLDVTESAQLQIVLGRTQLDATIDSLTVSSVQIIDWTYYEPGGDRVGITLANQPAGKVTCHPVGPAYAPTSTIVERAELLLEYLRARAEYDREIEFDWDASLSPSALEADDPAALAAYLTSPTTYQSLLRQITDSLLAGIWTTRTGTVAVRRWAEPNPSDITLVLDERNIATDVLIAMDTAPNLRRRVAGRRNHAVHGEGDIAGSVSPDLRAELTSEWGYVANGANAAEGGPALPLSAAYIAAYDRDPLQTLLQEPTDIDALANALCTLWRPTRCFYDLSVVLDADAADALEPGQTVLLRWSRIAGLAGGIPLRVVRVRSRFWARRVDLRLWGSAPPKTAS